MAAQVVAYNDPSVLADAGSVEKQLGLPTGLLTSVITNGEKSNSDQVSSAGARTVAQITPSTRQLAIKAYGIDPYLSQQNAIEVAGNLLKDSLDRNDGSVKDAIGEYIGGTNRDNWGKTTNAYIQRVTAGIPDASQTATVPASQGNATPASAGGPSTFDNAMAAQAAGQAGSVANVYKAYQSGQMNPADAQAFEQHVQSGDILLPRGASLKATAAPAPTSAPAAPDSMIQAYQSGQMNQQDRQDFESLVKSGQLSVPDGTIGTAPAPTSAVQNLQAMPGAIAESVTGSQRHTATTGALPDYAGMPELNQASMASFKTGLGTMTANPQEIGQIVQANFPDDKVSHDEKGNVLITSSIDGKTYAVKPGFQFSDIPRALGAVAAFTPAGRAETIAGGALASAGTQAAIEGAKVATGGNFDAGNVLGAGVIGGAAPLASRLIGAASDGVGSLLGRVKGTPDPIAAAEGASPEAANVAPQPSASPEPIAPAAPTVAPVVPMSSDDLAATARQAGQGNASATDALAAQAAPDAKTVASAQRLGIQDYLQPDHVTTNQAYRELAQAVKSVPGSSARSAELEGLQQVGQRATALIDELSRAGDGGGTDLSALSQDTKASLNTSVEEQKALADKAWAAYRKQIPNATPVETPSTTQALQSMANDLGGADGLSKALPAAAKKFLTPMLDGDPVTHGYLDLARKQIGNAIAKGAGPFSDLDQGTLKHLYSTVTADQESVAMQVGGAALDTFNQAKAATTLQKGFEDDLSSLFGKKLDQDFVGAGSSGVSGAFAAAAKNGDTSGVARLLSSVPAEMRERVTMAGIGSALRVRTGAQGQYGISFPNYVNFYEGLQRNRQAYSAVMSNLPLASRKQLAALYNVAKGVQTSLGERIQTGRIMAVKDQLKGADNLMSRLYETAKASGARVAGAAVIGHLVGPGIGAAIGSALAQGAKPEAIKAVDQLISSPEFAKAIADSARGKAPQAAKALGNSAKFQKFVSAVGSPADMSDRQRWILQALQANNSQGNH